MWNNTTNTESICALNQIVCRNYLSACFPTALEVFMFQFQVELKFLSASSMGCCCSILNPFFPPEVPTTGFCAWNQLSSSTEQPSVACSSLPPLLSRKHHCSVPQCQYHFSVLRVPVLSAWNSSFQFCAAPDFARRNQTLLQTWLFSNLMRCRIRLCFHKSEKGAIWWNSWFNIWRFISNLIEFTNGSMSEPEPPLVWFNQCEKKISSNVSSFHQMFLSSIQATVVDLHF